MEDQWIFDEPELLCTPSIQDGMSIEKEKEMRAKGVNFIRQVGILLKLPQLTLSTASIFFHRYLMRMSLVDRPGAKALHHYTLAATCLFLATKVEESCRKMKDLVISCCRVAQKNPNLVIDEQSKDFWRWRDTIQLNEDVLLETLCFDMTIEPAHKVLFEMLKYYRIEENKALRNAAWAFVTDSDMTQLCLICPSRTIAAAALYAGARMCDVRIPDTRDRQPWWEEQGVKLEELVRAVNYMCLNYEVPPQKPAGDAIGLDAGTEGGIIYVGLLIDFDKGQESTEEDRPWERTRLKLSEQSIDSPIAVTLPDNENTTNGLESMQQRKGSGASVGTNKRSRDAPVDGVGNNDNQDRENVKRPRVAGSPSIDMNGKAVGDGQKPRGRTDDSTEQADALTEKTNGVARVDAGVPESEAVEKADASEEGEVEE